MTQTLRCGVHGLPLPAPDWHRHERSCMSPAWRPRCTRPTGRMGTVQSWGPSTRTSLWPWPAPVSTVKAVQTRSYMNLHTRYITLLVFYTLYRQVIFTSNFKSINLKDINIFRGTTCLLCPISSWPLYVISFPPFKNNFPSVLLSYTFFAICFFWPVVFNFC